MELSSEMINLLHRQGLIIEYLQKTVCYFHKQNQRRGIDFFNMAIELLSQCFPVWFANKEYFNQEKWLIEENNIIEMLNELEAMQKDRDWVLLADFLEKKWIPLLEDLQLILLMEAKLPITDEEIGVLEKEGYFLEYTTSGDLTLALTDEKGKYYIHSNVYPRKEGFELEKAWYEEDKDNYIILGLGLGYHVRELFWENEYINIEVYEPDSKIIELAEYTDELLWWKKANVERVKVIHDPKLNFLANRLGNLKQNEKFCVFYPTIRGIKNLDIREKFENYHMHYLSDWNQRVYLPELLQSQCRP